MSESRMQAHGNADVVAALEKMLAEARKGMIGYVAIQSLAPERTLSYFGGSIELLPRAFKETVALLDVMRSKLIERELPPRDPSLDASYFCYNACSSPLSFDFLAALVDAEMTRVRHGAPFPLKVHFWFGRDGVDDPRITGDSAPGLGLPARKTMLENVCRPMLKLIGAVEEPKAAGGRSTTVCTTRGIVEAARAGEPVPRLRAPWWRWASPVGGYVTITLRENPTWPHRNSNIEAWRWFAEFLEERGNLVVFVRETAMADVPIVGHQICPEAATDLHTRMALYQSAKANLFVSNGPASLAWFTDVPWLMFTAPEDESDGGNVYKPNTGAFWRDNMGIAIGEQWPWARPDQRIVWAKDDYETIVAAWERWIAPGRKQVQKENAA